MNNKSIIIIVLIIVIILLAALYAFKSINQNKISTTIYTTSTKITTTTISSNITNTSNYIYDPPKAFGLLNRTQFNVLSQSMIPSGLNNGSLYGELDIYNASNYSLILRVIKYNNNNESLKAFENISNVTYNSTIMPFNITIPLAQRTTGFKLLIAGSEYYSVTSLINRYLITATVSSNRYNSSATQASSILYNVTETVIKQLQ
ncbi:MAG: hypothetical protein ARM1_0834 [Candidatus Micrarchaeota archaeon]|nr:MAG: hypothetical protein ARM1_0834 [Candidatus Micrarchaeota archaeon]